jgi:LacI family transcriptional regulator
VKNNNVTMQRIAREAGVSISTVSRVLAGKPIVAESTRSRIQALIDRYDYHPNLAARSLVQRRSNMLGLLVPNIENPYFASMFLQAERTAAESGYSLWLTSSISSDNELNSLGAMRKHQVDGMILAPLDIQHDESLERLLGSINYLESERVVLMDDPPEDYGIAIRRVIPDNRLAYQMATNYLLSIGHRRIAFIGGFSQQRNAHYASAKRLAGYRMALEGHGVPFDPAYLYMEGCEIEDGERGLAQIFGRGVMPTAVITMSDQVAMGVVRMCGMQGLSIPRDISIIGCDNTFLSRGLYPALTSIDIDPGLQGEMAVRILISVINGESPPMVSVLSPKLIIRASTTCPRESPDGTG